MEQQERIPERDKLLVRSEMMLKKEWVRIINKNSSSEGKYYLCHADLYMEFYDFVNEQNVVFQNYIYQILSMKIGREKAEYQIKAEKCISPEIGKYNRSGTTIVLLSRNRM